MKHVARKRFGQNFLVSPGVIRNIVAGIKPTAGDLMVEIGPGLAPSPGRCSNGLIICMSSRSTAT